MTGAALAACLLIALGACSSSEDGGSSDNPPVSDEGDGFTAEVMCEEFVKERLASPSSAEFSEQDHAERAGSTWLVTGVVDSENKFGAMLRADYACTMRYLGDDEWQGRKVSVTER